MFELGMLLGAIVTNAVWLWYHWRKKLWEHIKLGPETDEEWLDRQY